MSTQGTKWKCDKANYCNTKKAIRLVSFAHFQEHSSPPFKNQNMLKHEDIMKTSNILFSQNTVNNNAPIILKIYFDFKEINHQHSLINNLDNAYIISEVSLQLPICKTTSGKTSMKYICSITWNQMLKELWIANIKKYGRDPYRINNTRINSLILKNSYTKITVVLKKHFLEGYWAH